MIDCRGVNHGFWVSNSCLLFHLDVLGKQGSPGKKIRSPKTLRRQVLLLHRIRTPNSVGGRGGRLQNIVANDGNSQGTACFASASLRALFLPGVPSTSNETHCEPALRSAISAPSNSLLPPNLPRIGRYSQGLSSHASHLLIQEIMVLRKLRTGA